MPRLDWRKPLASGQTPEELLEDLYFSGKTDKEGAALLSAMTGRRITPQAFTQKRQTLGLDKTRGGVPLVKISGQPKFDNPPTVSGDVLVLEDLHVPFHDSVFLNRCLNLAELWNLRTLVLSGDVLDLVALSKYAPEYGEDKPSLEDELEAAGQFFDACQEFDTVLWLGGTHERRFLYRLERGIKMSRLAMMVTSLHSLEASDYHYCLHEWGWVFGHPDNTSIIPARVPQFLSRKFSGYNVATGHTHLWGMAQAEDGKRLVVDVGVACDPAMLAYVSMRLNTRPMVSQGAFILKRKKPWLLSPLWTDWQALRSVRWD